MKNILKYVVLLTALITTAQAQTTPPPKPEMVNVQGGTFNMGDNSISGAPVHSVTVATFNIAMYPTTVAEYKAFCAATNQDMADAPSWGWNDMSPVVNVSYNDAIAYCKWLSEKYNGNYRLPTEAEYEYAARGGNKSNGYTYSGGNNMNELGWYVDNSGGQTNSVGKKKANELGLYDMSGNVWEWCMDWYDAGYYSVSPSLNPKGPESGSTRVLRGGSWNVGANTCRVAYRYYSSPEYRIFHTGFRVVATEADTPTKTKHHKK